MSNQLYNFSCVLIILFVSGCIHGKADARTIPELAITYTTPRPAQEWFADLDNAREARTILHFFVHDVTSGPNQSVYKVAQSDITANSSTFFGQINMLDELLTVGPEYDSEVVGRAQGTAGFAGMSEFAVQIGFNFVFTGAQYNGSTISILGRNLFFDQVREMPVVGGTGVFRLARGIAVSSTHSSGVIEYTLYVILTTFDDGVSYGNQ